MINRTLVLFISLVFSTQAFSQTKFVQGFNDGFKNGYCYSNNKAGYFCTPPLPPLAPLPQINESKDSYQDGYNRGFLYGQARRSKDDSNTSNSNPTPSPPKFNPYVPQSPVLSMTPEERALYYSNKARRDQAMGEAIGGLLEAIFTTSEEGRARRAERRAKKQLAKEIKEEYKKQEKEIKKSKIREATLIKEFNNSKIIDQVLKIENITLASYDFPKKMDWQNAEIACALLGKGWRLPTIDELSIMFKNKGEENNFKNSYYWSSTKSGEGSAWIQDFSNGVLEKGFKTNLYHVRAIKTK